MLFKRISLSLGLLAVAVINGKAAAQIRVDLGPEVGRKDTAAPHWQEWEVPRGQSATREFGPVRVTLSAAGKAGASLAGEWYKPSLETGAAVAADGVAVQGGQIDMTINGLLPGRHTIVTYHNNVSQEEISNLDIDLNGKPLIRGLKPSHRAGDDYDIATAFIPVEVKAGEPVVIGVRPDGGGGLDKVILNGFEIDAPDPAAQAAKPLPGNDDEHVEGGLDRVLLSWTPARAAVAHDVYLGTDPKAVRAAGHDSAEFKGNQTGAGYSARGLLTHPDYYWRVDEVDGHGTITPGDVWRFRLAHLAFPSAEGYGRFARGGRGGRVIEVTNLDDDGPGSLRAAVEAEGPRTVVFRVSGLISLKSKLVVHNPYITIAGQTAPGDGICLRNYTFGLMGAHDVIIRFVRQRMGDLAGQTMDGCGAASSDHAIFDHCSISWSIDEGFSSRAARNITLQRSIIAEALQLANHDHYLGTGKGHSFAGSISGRRGSFHHNLLVHTAGRNWSLAGGYDQAGRYDGFLDIRNNVVYNWLNRTNDGGVKMLNLVNNYYKPGPATVMFDLLKFDGGRPEDPQYYYVSGNVIEGKLTADDPRQGVVLPPEFRKNIFLTDTPVFQPFVTTQTAREAYESVLADVGCNRPAQDAMDQRLTREVREGSTTYTGRRSKLPGIIDTQEDSGGWPAYAVEHRPEGSDSDHDGMPDDWERKHGLNPDQPQDGAADLDGDGYTNLEDYLNWLAGDLKDPSAGSLPEKARPRP
jgi:hypothetical protein